MQCCRCRTMLPGALPERESQKNSVPFLPILGGVSAVRASISQTHDTASAGGS